MVQQLKTNLSAEKYQLNRTNPSLENRTHLVVLPEALSPRAAPDMDPMVGTLTTPVVGAAGATKAILEGVEKGRALVGAATALGRSLIDNLTARFEADQKLFKQLSESGAGRPQHVAALKGAVQAEGQLLALLEQNQNGLQEARQTADKLCQNYEDLVRKGFKRKMQGHDEVGDSLLRYGERSLARAELVLKTARSKVEVEET